jgi:hypothetical protein
MKQFSHKINTAIKAIRKEYDTKINVGADRNLSTNQGRHISKKTTLMQSSSILFQKHFHTCDTTLQI